MNRFEARRRRFRRAIFSGLMVSVSGALSVWVIRRQIDPPVVVLAILAGLLVASSIRYSAMACKIGRFAFFTALLTAMTYPLACAAIFRRLLRQGAEPLWLLHPRWLGISSPLQLNHQLALFLGVIVAALITMFGTVFRIKRDSLQHIRGRRLITFAEAKSQAMATLSNKDPGIFWGGLWLPLTVATQHFFVTGTTGAGKTLCLRLLMKSVLPRISEKTATRALVYDAKQDAVAMLSGMGIQVPIHIFNPFDPIGAAWDMATDINDRQSAYQLASILIPIHPHAAQPFFDEAARDILAGAVHALILQNPGRWTFADVVTALQRQATLRILLASSDHTSDRLEYLSEERTASSVLATIKAKMQPFVPIADAWQRAETRISLRAWLKQPSILVLGNDETNRTALDAINRVILQRVTELILAQPETKGVRTWVFLDEVREAGKLTSLGSLLNKGRSKGAAVVLGFQDVDGLRHLYGTHRTNELLGQCGNRIYLRLESAETAEWASRAIGSREVMETRKTESRDAKGQKSQSTSHHRQTMPLVMSTEFMNLPLANKKTGLHAYAQTPAVASPFSLRLSANFLHRFLYN